MMGHANNPETHACPICGKQFQALRRTQLYCSKACSIAHRSEKRRQTARQYVHTCPTCGKSFETVRPNHVYCCEGCRERSGIHVLTRCVRHCAACGREFSARSASHLYCSPECKLAAGRRAPVQLVCPVCGKEFTPHNGFQHYCSKKCTKDAINAKRRESIEDKKRICKVCGVEFISHVGTQLYCSHECFMEARRASKRERSRRIAGLPETKAKRHAYYMRPDVRARHHETGKRWAAANKEKVRAIKRRYELSEKGIAAHKRYLAGDAYKAQRQRKCAIRRFRKHNNGGMRSDCGVSWQALVKKTGSLVCAICGRECIPMCPDKKKRPTLDHIVSLQAGGTNTWDNVVLLCMRCNSLKGHKRTIEQAKARLTELTRIEQTASLPMEEPT